MVPAVRVIPCLDVASGRVVKGVNFQNLVDSGDPVDLARNYYLQGSDELTFLDVTAANENRSTTRDMVTRCAEEIFIPLTVGGGIRSLEDVSLLLEAGADKVSIGSAGISRPELLAEISGEHGNQILVVSLDIKRGDTASGFVVTSHGGRQETGLDAMQWIEKVQALGAGELLINSIDADGTRAGFDLELIEKVRKISAVPIIASGGAGKVSDFVEAAQAGADALLAASVFHSGEISIATVKQALEDAGIEAR
ncbi:imidazole glycerol phosphate synthase subunit HisF [Aquiluna sp. Uisw_065]|uniref:imidazole glycerol phosphate synthase subunit HisF n=1 Tax=Aquiluna sp. Uisw_065 TaxID=3230967 RepID=UPI0039EC5D3C